MKKCDICGEEHPDATLSCSACDKVVKKYQGDTRYSIKEVREALNHAYSCKDIDDNESCFRCEYTGIVCKFNNKKELGTYKDPFVLTLDHKNPPEKELSVSLNIVNKMKGDIPYEKFKHVVIALGEFFKNDISEKELENELKQIFDILRFNKL